MARIGLAAGTEEERRILEYLEASASGELAAKIAAGSGTLAGAVAHCGRQAERLARRGGGARCVCVDDARVFGWAVDYFEEQPERRAEPARKPGTPDGAVAERRTEAVPEAAGASGARTVRAAEDGEADGIFAGVDVLGGGL